MEGKRHLLYSVGCFELLFHVCARNLVTRWCLSRITVNTPVLSNHFEYTYDPSFSVITVLNHCEFTKQPTGFHCDNNTESRWIHQATDGVSL